MNAVETIARWAREQRGTAGIEFALIATAMVVPLLNVIDGAKYVAERMLVENAAQMGAQAAWQTCGPGSLPATASCAALTQAVTAAAQSTSLGTAVAIVTGSPSEGYYCINGSNALTLVAAISSTEPSDCSAVGQSSRMPGDYIEVQVTHSFTSLFPGMTITATLPATMTKTAWMRLG